MKRTPIIPMRNYLFVLLLGFLIISCGSSKKVITPTSETTKVDPVIHDTYPVKGIMKDTMEVVAPSEGIEDTIKVIEEEVVETIPAEVTIEPEITNSIVTFNHIVWNELLQKNVSEKGVVDYQGFQKNRTQLRSYITSLGNQMPTENWSEEEKLAYWMNAYNAMTVDLILRNIPIESIKDIDKPWKQRLWKLGEKWYNLDEIEHQILRKMGDPRIHFGINCASFSCPPLLNEAFTSEKVEGQLEGLARTFVNDSKRNSISSNSVEISKIFNWFAKDFKTEGSLIDFLNTYSTIPINPKARTRYKDYDWSLNN